MIRVNLRPGLLCRYFVALGIILCVGTIPRVVWSSVSTGAIRTVALSGQHAAGTASGVTFIAFEDEPILNAAGQVAFQGSLSGVDINSANSRGIWSDSFGTLALVTRTGDHAPGTPDGVNFNGFLAHSGLNLNDLGQLAFGGVLTGSGVSNSNNFGWYSEGGDMLSLVARAGSQAPDTPVGANFRAPPYSIPQLNNMGKSVFIAELNGSGVDNSNRRGI